MNKQEKYKELVQLIDDVLSCRKELQVMSASDYLTERITYNYDCGNITREQACKLDRKANLHVFI